eukprot:m.125413 g.125413  ORF g.125413 m.125413 type:complete len:57 (-) comp15617_c0_seq1:277-447(-)
MDRMLFSAQASESSSFATSGNADDKVRAGLEVITDESTASIISRSTYRVVEISLGC